MKILQASFETIVLRYFLMMGVVFVTFLSGQFLLGCILALPVFLSAILGIVFWEPKSKQSNTHKAMRHLTMDQVEQAA